MKPPPFGYCRAGSVEQALALLAEHGDDAKLLAGGQSLVPMLNLRLARPSFLVDVDRLALDQISVIDASVEFGAMVRHQTLERSAVVAAAAPLLQRCAPLIGHAAIRNRGTLGGSIAHADPAAELPTVATALDARFEIQSIRGVRHVAASEFFEGSFMTVLEPDEMLVGIQVMDHGDYGCAYEEMSIRAGDFAVAGVAAAIRVNDAAVVEDARIALSGVGGTPVRASDAERALIGSTIDEDRLSAAAEAAYEAAANAPDDIHGTRGYRRALARLLTRRAVTNACRGLPT